MWKIKFLHYEPVLVNFVPLFVKRYIIKKCRIELWCVPLGKRQMWQVYIRLEVFGLCSIQASVMKVLQIWMILIDEYYAVTKLNLNIEAVVKTGCYSLYFTGPENSAFKVSHVVCCIDRHKLWSDQCYYCLKSSNLRIWGLKLINLMHEDSHKHDYCRWVISQMGYFIHMQFI